MDHGTWTPIIGRWIYVASLFWPVIDGRRPSFFFHFVKQLALSLCSRGLAIIKLLKRARSFVIALDNLLGDLASVSS